MGMKDVMDMLGKKDCDINTLARELNTSKSSVCQSLHNLRKYGWVEYYLVGSTKFWKMKR